MNLEIIDWPKTFIGMLMSLNMEINTILVQQLFNAVRMSQWDSNTDLCIQRKNRHTFRTKDFSKQARLSRWQQNDVLPVDDQSSPSGYQVIPYR